MSILSNAGRFVRFLPAYRRFLRETLSVEEARAIVRRRIDQREANFLRVVEQCVFGHPDSPYLAMLKLARCELGDLETMLASRGLEETLRALREAGVYLSFEEFKGREPIVRNGEVLHVSQEDFDNPRLSTFYRGETGGTTGQASLVQIDLDHLAAQAPLILLGREAHAVLEIPSGIWMGVLPDASGPNNVLRPAKFGQVPRKWFSSIPGRKAPWEHRMLNHSLVWMGRLSGVPLPWPEPLALDQAHRAARWIADTLAAEGACLFSTHVSKALRVSLAAQEGGMDLSGAVFLVGGEPPTPAKVKGILGSGASCIPVYPFSEHGTAGFGCARPLEENDLHLSRDTLALIQVSRRVPGSELRVDAFHFTSLLCTAPKILLNVESDDYGILEERSCGCPLEGYGFVEHLRRIRSFRKLTGEGATLVGSDLLRILEEELPARFGGSALDYQLVEEEDERGFTRVTLLVDPEVPIDDEDAVVEAITQAIPRGWSPPAWREGRTLRVRRMKPVLTNRGKLMPLHLSREGGES
jgi:hypothetical protein